MVTKDYATEPIEYDNDSYGVPLDDGTVLLPEDIDGYLHHGTVGIHAHIPEQDKNKDNK